MLDQVIDNAKKTAAVIVLCVISFLPKYWEYGLGTDWRWWFDAWDENGRYWYSSFWFMEDLAFYITILLLLLLHRILSPDYVLFRLKRISLTIWDPHIVYVCWRFYDYVIYQNQTDYFIREIVGIGLIVLSCYFYKKK